MLNLPLWTAVPTCVHFGTFEVLNAITISYVSSLTMSQNSVVLFPDFITILQVNFYRQWSINADK